MGSEHPDVATDRRDLGGALRSLGELVSARSQLELALAIHERALGSDHPDVADDRSNLGKVLQALGDLAGARTQYERALAIHERARGPDHPNAAAVLNRPGFTGDSGA